jgi:hypothetical protein
MLFRKNSRSSLREGLILFRRVVRILLRVVGSIVLLVLLLVAFLFWYMTPPSDASLERRFQEHRADLEQIVKMMEQDVHMQRIAEDFTRNDDWDQHPGHAREISDQRWNQYREIFRRAGVPKGTERQSDDIEIIAWTAGLAIAGTSLSYLHCGNPSVGNGNFYPPCLERDEAGTIKENDDVIRYKRIQGDWYIYEFSN